MGCVISSRHLERIEGMLHRRGSSNILAGGTRMVGKSALDGFDFSKGSFFPPTVVTDVNVEDELWQEEIFGPVVVVRRFSVSVSVTILTVAECNSSWFLL
jgi:acyl-CoA reductase-like NAD-dependent aldehyde dehydrogenase